jgi:hypothetical protein
MSCCSLKVASVYGDAGGGSGAIDVERRRINCPAVEKMKRKRDDGKAIV